MLKQWFQSSPNGGAAARDFNNGAEDRASETAQRSGVNDAPSGALTPQPGAAAIGRFAPFEEIYRNAPVKASKVAYDILKIAEMVNSSHLAGMSPEAKRCSLMMALEAIDVDVEVLLQDAMVRQRALNDYDDAQQKKLDEFRAAKVKENSLIQAELDRLSSVHTARIQANLDEVARQEDHFHHWRKQKQEESEHIAEAAAFCAPPGAVANGGGLAATLARCSVEAVGGGRR